MRLDLGPNIETQNPWGGGDDTGTLLLYLVEPRPNGPVSHLPSKAYKSGRFQSDPQKQGWSRPNKPVDTCFTHGSWHHPLSPSLLKFRQRRAEHQGLSAFTRKRDGSKLRDPAKEKQFSLYSWAQTQH